MPPTRAVLLSGSTRSTRSNADRSRPAAAASASRNRNRFDVRLARRTGAPGGRAEYDSRTLATATSCELAVMRKSFRLSPSTHYGNDRGRTKDKIRPEQDEP